jgi:hypothetical protein
MVDSGATGPELNIGVALNGNIYVGGWNSVARSRDDGATWTLHATNPAVGFAADRVLIVDKDTGRIYEDDTTLGCTILSWSDDEGESWLTNPMACGGGATDHQKIAVGHRTTLADPTGLLYPNLVYVCANGLSHTDCGVSNDGGLTFLPAAPHGVGCAFHGTPITNAAGTLYIPTSQCGLKLRKNTQDGLGTWQEFTLPASRFPASNDAPDIAITDDGTLYFFYTTADWKPAFARSTNGGAAWQGPFAVPVSGLRSSVFPVIVGGADGRIGLAFYGTNDAPVGWNGNPGNAPTSVKWDGYVAVITDAASAAPTVAPVKVTSDPLQIGCLSKLGSCLGNIADYEDIDVGPDGRVYAVFTDGCIACTSAATSTEDRGVVAVQSSGPALR